MEMRVAFFDVDDTILHGSSGLYLARYLMIDRGEAVELSMAGEMVKQFLVSKFRPIEYEKVVRLSLQRFEGRTTEEMRTAFSECYEKYLVRNIYKRAVRQVRWHQRNGHKVVLLTASIQMLMEMVGSYLEVDETIATKPKFVNNRLISEWEGTLCYEDGKLALAREYCERVGASLKNCYFYSDSISDMPLLREVGNPVATNPDRVLLVQCLLRNWRIMQFSSTLGSKAGSLTRVRQKAR